jgi:hypothetical protein
VTTTANTVSRVGVAAASVLAVGGAVAAYFAVFAPEVGFAWARVSEECGKSPVLRDCLDLVRVMNGLRVRTWLVGFCFLFGGLVGAVGCCIATCCLAPPPTTARPDGRRATVTMAIVLVALAAIVVTGGLLIALRLS